MEQNFNLIAKTFMGLEPVLAKELTQLGANDVLVLISNCTLPSAF